MTAEVIVLNLQGIAMAADSAVTIRRPGPEGSYVKIYDSANKLFQLSKSSPIAIMAYGSGSLESVPWETIVKEFRRDLGDTAYETVEQYGQRFIEHLGQLVLTLPWSQSGQFAIDLASAELHQVIQLTWERMRALLIEAAFSDSALSGSQFSEALLAEISKRKQYLINAGFFEDLEPDIVSTYLSEVISDWHAFLENIFASIGFEVDDELQAQARELVELALRSCNRSYWHSGIVIAGFGQDEFFPAYIRYDIDGVVAGRLRLSIGAPVSISPSNRKAIVPLAQDDVILTMINGMHPNIPSVLRGYLGKSFDDFGSYLLKMVMENVSEAEAAELESDLLDFRSTVVESFSETLEKYVRSQHSDPILNTVEGLPKEQLAEMAESLVNLTSFQRRVTPGDESVGGPVDVAVISKGDGFVWIKRKHYFAPEYNPRYMQKLGAEN